MASKNITEADQRRFDIITKEVGCIPCRLEFARYIPAQANHLLEGHRIGHGASVPECPWHHMGECLVGVSTIRMKRCFGPSRKLHKKQFRKKYGSDQALLALTNEYVKAFEAKVIGGSANHATQKQST